MISYISFMPLSHEFHVEELIRDPDHLVRCRGFINDVLDVKMRMQPEGILMVSVENRLEEAMNIPTDLVFREMLRENAADRDEYLQQITQYIREGDDAERRSASESVARVGAVMLKGGKPNLLLFSLFQEDVLRSAQNWRGQVEGKMSTHYDPKGTRLQGVSYICTFTDPSGPPR